MPADRDPAAAADRDVSTWGLSQWRNDQVRRETAGHASLTTGRCLAMDEQYTALVDETVTAYRGFIHILRAQALSAWLQLDLSLSQLKVLLLVADEEALYVSTVASRLGSSRTTASLVIDQLVKRRLVTRTDDPIDRRRALVRLTPEGCALMERLYPDPADDLCQYLAGLEMADLLAVARSLQALSAAKR